MSIAWPIVAFVLGQISWWAGIVKNEWEALIGGIVLHCIALGLLVGWIVT